MKKFSGSGGPGMTIGQIMANSANQAGCEIRNAVNGWSYAQISGDRANGTHITIRPSGLADHASTYLNGFPIGREDIRFKY